MAKKSSKLRGVIITIIIVIVAVYLLPRIADFLLMFEDVALSTSPVIDITEEYYSAYPVSNNAIQQQSYEWASHKRWKATWKIPDDVLNDANRRLRRLEETTRNRTRYKEYSKYYRTLTNYNSTPEEFWSAVYKLIRNDNEEKVKIISDIMRYAIQKNELDSMQSIEMILSFVQEITYYIPKENYFEVYPPLNSIIANKGDCDTKSIMFAMILEDLGYDAVVFYSSKYLHAMAGVNINGRGTYKTYAGKRYYFVETTAKGWSIGRMPYDMKNLIYWHTIDL